LGRYNRKLKVFARYNTRIYGVSVDQPKELKKLHRKLNLRYPLLSDAKRTLLKKLQLEHEGMGIYLPSVYIVNTHGKIVWKKIGRHLKDRPSAKQVLAILQKLHTAQTPKASKK